MDRRILQKLSQCPLLQSLDDLQLAQLFDNIPVRYSQFPKGKLVAFRGDPLVKLMLLIEGQLSAEIVSMKGKILKVETLKAPCTIAGPMLFADESTLPVQLTADTNVEVVSLNKEDALSLLSYDGAILRHFLTDSGNKIAFLSEKIRLYQFHSIRQKLAVYLLDLQKKQKSSNLTLPMKIETMAELFSVTRPSLSRSLSVLVEEGILARNGRQIEILDEEELRMLMEESD